MANIKISFNGAEYQIDESALSSATAALKSHLSTVMNGSGATITFGGVSYSIDSSKLSDATSSFVSHLGTVAGSGSKVVVNGVEYGIDSSKIAGAVSDLNTILGGLSGSGDNGSSENQFPVAWNTADVVGNAAFEFMGASFVKVSDAIPTLEMFQNAYCVNSFWNDMLNMNAMMQYSQHSILGNILVIVYSFVEGGATCSETIVCVPEAGNYDGIIISEPGIYAIDYKAQGIDAHCVIYPV